MNVYKLLAIIIMLGQLTATLAIEYSSNLHTMVQDEKNLVDVARLLADKGIDLDARNNDDMTPLYIAARCNNIKMVELLIKKGAQVNASCNSQDNFTPLHIAACCGFVDVCRVLIDNKATVNFTDTSPLHLAAYYGFYDVVALLLDRNADVNAQRTTGDSPLHYAATANNYDVIRLLLKYGANIFQANKHELTPLYLLQQQGWNYENNTQETMLHTVGRSGNIELANELLASDSIDIYAQTSYGQTALYLALCNSHSEIMELILQHEKQQAYQNKRIGELERTETISTSFLRKCAQYSRHWNAHPALRMHRKFYMRLVKAVTSLNVALLHGIPFSQTEREWLRKIVGDDFNTLVAYLQPVKNRSDLLYCPPNNAPHLEEIFNKKIATFSQEYRDRIKMFLEDTTNNSSHPRSANAALEKFIATMWNNDLSLDRPTLCEIKSYDIDALCNDGYNALHVAVSLGDGKMVGNLLKHGADSNVKSRKGVTPLDIALWDNNEEMVKLLLAYSKIDVVRVSDHDSVHNGSCDDELMKAIDSQDICHVGRILEQNARCGDNKFDINALCNRGYNALHTALEACNLQIVKLLLAYGADINAQDSCGNNALHHVVDYAFQNDLREVVAFLVEHKVNINAQNKQGKTPLCDAVLLNKAEMVQLLVDHNAYDADYQHEKQTLINIAERFNYQGIKQILLMAAAAEIVPVKSGNSVASNGGIGQPRGKPDQVSPIPANGANSIRTTGMPTIAASRWHRWKWPAIGIGIAGLVAYYLYQQSTQEVLLNDDDSVIPTGFDAQQLVNALHYYLKQKKYDIAYELIDANRAAFNSLSGQQQQDFLTLLSKDTL